MASSGARASAGRAAGITTGWARRSAARRLFGGAPLASPEMAECVRSALFLYYSALDDSHRVSQEINTPTGSFLQCHAQAGAGYSNAKYWFRRVGRHELFPTLRQESLRLPLQSPSLASAIRDNPAWAPLWLIDQVERAVAGDALLASDMIEIQRLEWELLFDYSYRRALGG